MTQGSEANHSGNFLESAIEREFSARRILVRTYAEDQENQDLFHPRVLVKNAPYRSIYGCASRSEFLFEHYPIVKCRIECRYQETPGSVDEKFPYLLMNARLAMPEVNIWLVIEGNGAREQAVKWLKREAQRVADKNIRVMNLVEAKKAIKDLIDTGTA